MINLESPAADLVRLRELYGSFPTGVAAVCGLNDSGPVGMAVSSFTSVSLDPPLVSVCMQRTSRTWPALSALSGLGVSVLSEKQGQTAAALAATEGDRFAGLNWARLNSGAVLLEGASAWFDCSLYSELEAGDHFIALLQVHAMQANVSTPPLVFHGGKFQTLSYSRSK